MIRVARTIRAGHPDIARICERHKFVGDVFTVRYYIDDDTGERFKTVEIRERINKNAHNKSLNRTAKKPAAG